MNNSRLQEFLDTLEGKLRFDNPQLALCTHYSWFGVVDGRELGIGQTHLFYNRRPALLSPELLTLHVARSTGEASHAKTRAIKPLAIEESDGRGFEGTAAFADTDVVCYHVRLSAGSDASRIRARFFIPETDPSYPRNVRYDEAERLLVVETRMPKSDPRDPDEEHDLTVCLRVPEGFELVGPPPTPPSQGGASAAATSSHEAESVCVEFVADARNLAEEKSFVLGIGEGPTAGEIEDRIRAIGDVGSEASREASEKWLAAGLDEFTFEGIADNLRVHYAKAAYQILSNTKAPRGRIRHLASYPSRGTYCAHYLWDACFTNLGVAQFNVELAKDFLRVLCENQEPDGKIPQFVCATWNRPGESQPPLIAWSAWRLYEQCGDVEFLREIYEPITRFVDWWFAKRDSDGNGLVEWDHRLESGWDNSPRFEKGRITAIDLNAYLNREMRLLAKMAGALGLDDDELAWERWAKEHAQKMRARLLDRDDDLFYDRIVETKRLHKVLTPASLMPLWTEVHMPPREAHEMVVKYLLNPKHFWGSRPFPVVAYSDRSYDSEKWWRGPVWPNIAWAMTEILRMHRFPEQYREAVKRLLDMMVSAEELNELYSSATGDPLGAEGLCWGDAIFMALARAEM